jgi:hypothetical protein
MRALAGLMMSVVVSVGVGASGQQAQTVDVTTLGPQVGQKAVGFQLPDQQGRTQSLASVAGPKGTMLVFFRSSDW